MTNHFEDDRLYHILKLITKKPYVSVNYIAEKLDVSTRTIRNDVKLLNEELNDIAFIATEQGNYKLYIINAEKYEEKVNQLAKADYCFNSPQKRIAFIIETLMRCDKPYLSDELAFDMNIGRTTLMGDIKKAKELLTPYNLDIVGKTNSGLILTGEEMNLRLFILENIYELIYNNYPLDNEIVDIVTLNSEKYFFESLTINEFLRFVTIMLDRMLTGNGINTINEKHNQLSNFSIFNFVNNVSDNIAKELNIEIPLEERIFISLPIVGMRTPTNIDSLANNDANHRMKDIVKKILDNIYYILNLELNCDNVINEFSNHISFMINRLKFGVKIKNHNAKEIKEEYPLAYKMAKIAAEVIGEEYNLVVTEDEICYLTIYFGVIILESNNTKEPNKVAIICGTGRGTALLISVQLKKILDKSTIIDLYADNNISPEKLEKYTFIFSTVKLNFKVKPPIILITEIFDEKHILSQLEILKCLNKTEGSVLDNSSYIITNLISEDLFFTLNSENGYLENISNMINNLTKKGFLDSGFLERIMEREKKSTMVFDNFIAFPHTINKATDKLILSLGVFNKPIVYDGRKISLVFLIALPEKDVNDALLVKIYDEIISIANNKEMLTQLSGISNYNQLLKCFVGMT